MSTYNLLSNINGAIRTEFTYSTRTLEGTQTPVETLQYRSGTCRDFALLFMEAVRSLGFGARFITGYLYDPALDGADGSMQGSGATHAWADVYLPGAGWVEYDPTNGLIAGRESDPRRGDARPLAGDPDRRHLRRHAGAVARHDGRRHRAREPGAVGRRPARRRAGGLTSAITPPLRVEVTSTL